MNLAQVIEWKYGPVADCNLSDGSIINWRHPTISQPTTSQLTLDTAEYVAFISGRAANDDIKRQLAALDAKRIRPLAEGDTAYLAKLNEQIKALRAKLK